MRGVRKWITDTQRPGQPLVLPIVVGVVLGLGARLVDEVAPRWVGNIGAAWFFAGFFVGRTERSLRRGVTSGATCLVTATLTYYAWRVLVDETISVRYLVRVGLFWLLAGAAVGVISGALGAKSNRWSAAWGVAIGVLLGEAASVVVLTHRWEQVVLEVLAAAGLLLYSRRQLSKLLPWAVAAGIAVTGAATLYRVVLR